MPPVAGLTPFTTLQTTTALKLSLIHIFNTKVAKAKQLVNAYKIDGVPSMGVAGKYYVDGTLAKGMTRALQIVEKLAKDAKPA